MLKAIQFTGRGVILLLMAALLTLAPMAAAHSDVLDPLGGGGGSSSQSTQNDNRNAPSPSEAPTYSTTENPFTEGNNSGETENKRNSTTLDDTDAGREFIKGYNPLKEYNPAESKWASALIWGIGKLTSALMWIIIAFFFLVTTLDFMYIVIPFTRPWLNDANEDGQGSSLPGFGGGSQAMGGWGAGGANQTAQKRSIMNKQWVSDEAVETVKRLGGSSQAQVGGGGMMGSPMGGMGGFGAMGAAPEQDANSTRNVLGTYIKKRVVTFVLLGIGIVLLTSSAILGFGMDVGTFILKVILYIGNMISGADVPELFG